MIPKFCFSDFFDTNGIIFMFSDATILHFPTKANINSRKLKILEKN